jgi:hypothetical protein
MRLILLALSASHVHYLWSVGVMLYAIMVSQEYGAVWIDMREEICK